MTPPLPSPPITEPFFASLRSRLAFAYLGQENGSVESFGDAASAVLVERFATTAHAPCPDVERGEHERGSLPQWASPPLRPPPDGQHPCLSEAHIAFCL